MYSNRLCYDHYQTFKNLKYYHEKQLNQRRFRDFRKQQRDWIRNWNDGNNRITIRVSTTNLSPLQIMWLHSRGGRTVEDVIEINGEYFVAMWNKNKYVPIILPLDSLIIEDYIVVNGADNRKVLRNKKLR